MKYVANNTDLLSSVGLSDLLSNLDISDEDDDGEDMWIASYEKIYPQNWAGSERKEQKHRNIVERIIAWPKIERNEVRKTKEKKVIVCVSYGLNSCKFRSASIMAITS